MNRSLILLILSLSCFAFADIAFFAVGIIDGVSDDTIQANLVLIDASTGEGELIGDPFNFDSPYYCTCTFGEFNGSVVLFVPSTDQLMTFDSITGDMLSNNTYNGLGNSFQLYSTVWDPSSATLMSILAINEKLFVAYIDPVTTIVQIVAPISGVDNVAGCIAAYDSNNGYYYITQSNFDVTAIDITDGGLVDMFTFGEDQVVFDIEVDESTEFIYVITNLASFSSILWSCHWDLDNEDQLDCDVIYQFPTDSLGAFPTDALYDQESGIFYAVLLSIDTSTFTIYGISTFDNELVLSTDLEDFYLTFPDGVYSMNYVLDDLLKIKQ